MIIIEYDGTVEDMIFTAKRIIWFVEKSRSAIYKGVLAQLHFQALRTANSALKNVAEIRAETAKNSVFDFNSKAILIFKDINGIETARTTQISFWHCKNTPLCDRDCLVNTCLCKNEKFHFQNYCGCMRGNGCGCIYLLLSKIIYNDSTCGVKKVADSIREANRNWWNI